MLRKATLLILIAAGLVAVWLIGSRGEDGQAARPLPVESADESGEQDALEEVGRSGDYILPPADPVQTEREVLLPRLSGRVEDPEGEPIEGARVVWTPLLPELAVRSWRSLSHGTLASFSVQRATAADGSFLLDVPRERPPVPSVVWVTHHDHLGAMFLLLADSDLAQPLAIRLEAAQATMVRVVDESRVPVSGAFVQQRGLVYWNDEPELDAWVVQGRRVFHHGATTDGDGLCVLPSIPTDVAVVATMGSRVSDPHQGVLPAELELVLRAGFPLDGEVVVAGDGAIQEGTFVHVETQAAGQWEALGSLAVGLDGRFGPYRFRNPDSGEGRCRLEGAGLTASPVEFVADHQGVHVVLEAELGGTLAVQIVDVEGRPIPSGRARALWEGSMSTAWAEADSEGRLQIRGLPKEATCSLQAEAIGHENWSFAPYEIPYEGEEPVVLTLRRAGSLMVVVRHGGEPVTTYDLVLWADDVYDYEWTGTRPDENGKYRLKGVPEGLLHLFAFRQGSAQSNTATVTVSASEEKTVELEIPGALAGVGGVIDGNTFEPLPSATVQPFTSFGGQFMTPVSEPVSVESDGSFRITSFSPGNARLKVQAPGYETDYVSASPNPGQPFDFGLLPLYQSRSILFQLVSDDVADFSGFTIKSSGMRRIGPLPFSAEGTAVLEGCVGGIYKLDLGHPEGTTTRITKTLYQGEPWEITWELEAGTELVVVLDEEGGGDPPESANVWVSYKDSEGLERMAFADAPEGTAVFGGIPGEQAVVHVWSAAGIEARSTVDLAPPGPQTIRVVLGLEDQDFRVVDQAGAPVPGVSVFLRCWDDVTGWYDGAATDAVGIFAVGSPPCDSFWLELFHPVLGHQFGTRVTVPSSPEVVPEIVFDPVYAVEVLLRDGNRPVTGVEATLLKVGSWRIFPSRHPDRDGRLRWEQIGPGSYELIVGAPGYWFTREVVEAKRGRGRPTIVEFRRTGSLRVEVIDATGEPVAGRRLEIRVKDSYADLAEWVRGGRATSSGGTELLTDSEGFLLVEGIPNGTYEVSLAEGPSLERDVDVPSAGIGDVKLRLP